MQNNLQSSCEASKIDGHHHSLISAHNHHKIAKATHQQHHEGKKKNVVSHDKQEKKKELPHHANKEGTHKMKKRPNGAGPLETLLSEIAHFLDQLFQTDFFR